MPINDLEFQNISSVQNRTQPAPVTVAAAATIRPSTYLTIVTGTTAVATIDPPVSGQHSLIIVASVTNFSGFVTTGNILVASVTNSTVWNDRASLFVFNPVSQKYHPQYPVSGTNF